MITPLARRKAVSALSLKPGDTVLEVGIGTGRNLSYLVNAVGLDGKVDAVLFSLSYSVLPEPAAALARAWERVRPRARLAVMDAGLPDNLLGRALGPLARLLVKLAPGDLYSDPGRTCAVTDRRRPSASCSGCIT